MPNLGKLLMDRLACAKRYNGHIQFRQLAGNLFHQVEALLRCKPRDDADKRR